ncbi:hypothetical protein AVEN_193633-1, partial [Araneus ventricosus]
MRIKLDDPAATTIKRALWPPHNSPHFERLVRRSLLQRYPNGVNLVMG